MSESSLFAIGHSPYTHDDEQFLSWKRKQAATISDRGADNADPQNERLYNDHMTRRCLDAYVCHQELDIYGQCLIKNKLWDSEKAGSLMLPETATSAIERVCKMPFHRYSQCITSKDNQETVVKTGMVNPNCRKTNESLIKCMQVHISEEESELDSGAHSRNEDRERHFNTRIEDGCKDVYTKLVRCGLNHLWEEYWRAITNYGEQEEFKSYQLENKIGAKNEYNKTIGDVKQQLKQSGVDFNSAVLAASSLNNSGGPSSTGNGASTTPSSSPSAQNDGPKGGWFSKFGWGRGAERDEVAARKNGSIPVYNDEKTQQALQNIYGSANNNNKPQPRD